MLDEIAEHLEDFRRQPGPLARPLQGIELCVQDTIGKAVAHTSSAAPWQMATGTWGAIEQDGHVVPRAATRSSGRSAFLYRTCAAMSRLMRRVNVGHQGLVGLENHHDQNN